MGAESIILGDGVFAVNGTDIALTRGGGQFLIEREYREIPADGDYGPVKGRIRKIGSRAKLVLNVLELLPANLPSMYPSLDLDTSDDGKDVLTAATDIGDGDYVTVSFTGRTKAGKAIYIELQNAINLENIDWPLVDKDEVVPAITYTATYTEDARTTEPWKVEFVKGTTYSVTITVDDGETAISGASVTFNSQTIETDESGEAVFTGVPVGNNQVFQVVAGGYQTYFGSVNVVDNDVSETISMTEL